MARRSTFACSWRERGDGVHAQLDLFFRRERAHLLPEGEGALRRHCLAT